jgi:protein gp37
MQNSHIEWTDHTFNPWEGCTKVSPASSTPFRITLEGLRPIDDFEGHRYTPAQWAKHDDEAQQMKDAGN